MRFFFTLVTMVGLLFVCPVHCFFEGTRQRKEPHPHEVAIPPGSKLTMTCDGHVAVDGVEVTVARDNSAPYRGRRTLDAQAANLGVSGGTGAVAEVLGKREEGTVTEGYQTQATVNAEAEGDDESQPGYSEAPPTAWTSHPTTAAGSVGTGSTWQTTTGGRSEDKAGVRSNTPLGIRPRWKRNDRQLRNESSGKFEWMGTTLSLLSVRLTDSGTYSCHDRGQMLSSLKVIVAAPPKKPILSCYKKSVKSKIRCEWSPSEPIAGRPQCSLFLSKVLAGSYNRSECSYSRNLSRCWCALNNSEDELRVLHIVYVCVTTIAGNATSERLSFIPWDILKPDPPSQVTVRAREGQETTLTVTWNYPISWNSKDDYAKLQYQISYHPAASIYKSQGETFKKSFTITDAVPGIDYIIQIRAKEQFEGLWSDWSLPVYARSWTAQRSTELVDNNWYVTVDPFYTEDNGSGTNGSNRTAQRSTELMDVTADSFDKEDNGSGTDGSNVTVSGPVSNTEDLWIHVVWICGSCVLLSVILAAYTVRHRGKIVSKLRSLSISIVCSEPTSPVPAPAPQEGQALVTFAPPRYQDALANQVEDEEGQEEDVLAGEEAIHFSNRSYFLVQRI